jgi:hypothetical protein
LLTTGIRYTAFKLSIIIHFLTVCYRENGVVGVFQTAQVEERLLFDGASGGRGGAGGRGCGEKVRLHRNVEKK